MIIGLNLILLFKSILATFSLSTPPLMKTLKLFSFRYSPKCLVTYSGILFSILGFFGKIVFDIGTF